MAIKIIAKKEEEKKERKEGKEVKKNENRLKIRLNTL